MGLAEQLKVLAQGIHSEQIGEACPADFVEDVMLDIAYQPVVEWPVRDPLRPIPKPRPVLARSDGRYQIDHPEDRDFRIVEADELKLMRARYLLLRGWYYERLPSLSHSQREQVLAWYFPGGVVWLRPDTQELGDA